MGPVPFLKDVSTFPMMRKKGFIIAIDGPAGSGKSTASRIVADRLNYLYVDTGAMYRALTWKALREKLDLTNEESLIELARKTTIDLRKDGKVIADDIDVTAPIRDPEVTRKVFHIARVPGVRELMVTLQRKMAQEKEVVVEGRDITTVVFPNADKKIYVDAAIPERVKRRYKELKERGQDTTIDEVEKELHSRDEEDRGRKVAPLRIANDAALVDTTHMSIDQVVEAILKIAND